MGTIVKSHVSIDVDRVDYVFRDLAAFQMSHMLGFTIDDIIRNSVILNDRWTITNKFMSNMLEFGRFWIHVVVLSHPTVCELDKLMGEVIVEFDIPPTEEDSNAVKLCVQHKGYDALCSCFSAKIRSSIYEKIDKAHSHLFSSIR